MSTYANSRFPQPVVDTREGIFKKTFHCRLPYIETISVEEIRTHGMPSTGDRDMDHAIAHEIVDRYLTINEMVGLMRRGVQIRVAKYADTKRIYEYIQAHLLAWREEIIEAHRPDYAPLEDLIDLDKLAGIVYDKAKYVFGATSVDDFYDRGFGEIFGDDIFTDVPEAVVAFGGSIPDPDEEVPEFAARESLESLFAARLR